MMSKTHRAPSRVTYEQNYPNWTARLPIDLYVELGAFLEESDQSRREFIAIALGKQKMNFEKIWDEAYDEGKEDGERNGHSMGETDGYNNGWQQGFNDGQKKGDEDGYNRGYAEGLERGKKEGYAEGAEFIYEKTKDQNKLWHYCAVCGEPIFIIPNSPAHQFIIDMMRFKGWKHLGCNPYW